MKIQFTICYPVNYFTLPPASECNKAHKANTNDKLKNVDLN
ncbi:hypothetical protein [Mucilaginibacter gynuensis]